MSRIPRGFSAFAFWIVLGLAMAVVPLACSSSSPSDAGGDAAHDMNTMTNPG
jgi:hypothetical protein